MMEDPAPIKIRLMPKLVRDCAQEDRISELVNW